MKTTILLTRHGETIWNKQQRVQGSIDIPLSDAGIMQAQKLAHRLKQLPITQIHSSKLKRAATTAQVIADTIGLSITQKHTGLNERKLGIYEGKTWKEVTEKFQQMGTSFFLSNIEGGESGKQFHNRVVKAFTGIVEKNKHETILIVCHGGVLRVLVRHLKSLPIEYDLEYDFANTSLSIFSLDDQQITQELIADASHLE